MININPKFSGSVTGTQAVVSLSGSFTGSGTIDNAQTASRLVASASFGLGMESFSFDGSTNQVLSIDTASIHFISGAMEAVANTTGSFVVTASISGLTQSFTKGDGSTFELNLPDTASVDLAFSMSNGLGIDTFTFENIADATVQLNTASAHFTVGVSASQAPILTTLSASFSTSQTNLSGSASTARDLISSSAAAALTAYSASEAGNDDALSASFSTSQTALSASLTTTDQNISSSVALLSGSASDARNLIVLSISGAFDAVSSSLTLTDQTISSSVAALSASASTARDAISASAATSLDAVSSSAATDIVTNSASIAALSASSALERLNFVETSSVIGLGNVIEFVKGDNSTYTNTIITSSFVKSVNGVLPTPATGNVSIAIAGVETGTSASLIAAAATADEGDVWIISGESGSLTGSNGNAYIYNSTSSEWLEISNLDQPENDARYVLKFGDTMTGALILNADPVLPLGAATRQYVDALSGSTSTARDTAALQVSGAFNAVSASFSTSQTALSSSISTDLTALSSSASTSRIALSASLTITDQIISSSVASLSGSASDARNAIVSSISGAFNATSASIATTVNTVSSSLSASIADLSASNSTAREFYITTASISGLTQSFSKGNGTTFEINLPDTGAVDLAFQITGGLGVDAFTFDNTADATVQLNTASAHFTVGVSASQAPTLTALSASLTVTDQSISSSVAALSASASTSRIALSASLTTTDQSISSSLALLSASAFISASISSMTASFTKGDTSISEIYIDTASYALTASYLEDSNLTYRENVTGAATYIITHNLNEQYPIVQSYDTATNLQTIPSSVTATNANNLTISYAAAFTGIVVVQK